MSKPNEPPLEIVEYNIKVKWSDGNEETIPKDFYNYCKDLQNIVDGFEEETIDHLKGKYGQEIEQAENLHAQNSERFVEDALNPLGKYKLVDEKKSD